MTTETWTQERIDLIKRTICPKGITNDEFALFMEQCKRAQLDPLLKQAFCVPCRANIGTKDRPNWVEKHEFRPAEAGMLARAESFPGFEGITSAEVYDEDPICIDYGAGAVEHRVNPAQRKGKLVGAWARVQRTGKVPLVVWVDFAAVVQSTPLWGKMPAVMARKCARVAALRTTYPEAFGGLYVAGERPDDLDTGEEAEQAVPVTREKPALPEPRRTEALEVSSGRAKVQVRRQESEDAQVEVPAREPGGDDGESDPIERECAVIVGNAAEATTQAHLDALKPRAMALPKDSPEKKRAAAALTEAFARIRAAAGAP